MEDIRAVMDAVGCDRAALFGSSEGAATCSVFAATYPERTSALVLFSPFIVGTADDECPWAWSPEFWELLKVAMEETWGTPEGSGVEFVTPSLSGNVSAAAWYGRYLRAAASPAVAVALLNVNTQIDIRPVLPTIRVPTLVLHRTDEVWVNVNYGRYASCPHPRGNVGRTLRNRPLPLGARCRRGPRGDRGVSDRGPQRAGDTTGCSPPSCSPTSWTPPDVPARSAMQPGVTCSTLMTTWSAGNWTASGDERSRPPATVFLPPSTAPPGLSAVPRRFEKVHLAWGWTFVPGSTRVRSSVGVQTLEESPFTSGSEYRPWPPRARYWFRPQ